MKAVVAILLVTLVCITGLLATNSWQMDLLSYVNQLRSDDIAERKAAAEVIRQHRQEAQNSPAVIAGIEQIVRDFAGNEGRKGTAKTAIELLGDLESSASVPLLVDHLTLSVFYKETKRPQTKEEQFPSVGALIKIGNVSLEPVLTRAQETDDEQVANCAAYVVKRLLKESAQTFIQERVAKQADPKVQQRLLRLEHYLYSR